MKFLDKIANLMKDADPPPFPNQPAPSTPLGQIYSASYTSAISAGGGGQTIWGSGFPYSGSTNVVYGGGGGNVIPAFVIHGSNGPLVTIKKDGTVLVHNLGDDIRAANQFYKTLDIEGKTLHAKIKELESKLDYARNTLNEIDSRIISSDVHPKAQYIKEKAHSALEVIQ